MDITDSLFSFLKEDNSATTSNDNNRLPGKDLNEVTGILMKAFKEADDKEEESPKMDDFDWDNIDFGDDNEDDSSEDESEEQSSENDTSTEEENNDSIPDETDEEETPEDDSDSAENQGDDEPTNEEENDNEEDVEEDNDENTDEEEGELIGEFSEIKDEITAHRESLSEIYERLFKNVISPLFRKLQDYNLNVAFDTTELLSHGIIKIKLSHMNLNSSAKMEINIFANTVNGEFLGLENNHGEVLSTDLNDVSLDDLINILIKVLA